jgi:hypothetical protein
MNEIIEIEDEYAELDYIDYLKIIENEFITNKLFTLDVCESITKIVEINTLTSKHKNLINRAFSIILTSNDYKLIINSVTMYMHKNTNPDTVVFISDRKFSDYIQLFNAIMFNIEDIVEASIEQIFNGNVNFIEP